MALIVDSGTSTLETGNDDPVKVAVGAARDFRSTCHVQLAGTRTDKGMNHWARVVGETTECAGCQLLIPSFADCDKTK